MHEQLKHRLIAAKQLANTSDDCAYVAGDYGDTFTIAVGDRGKFATSHHYDSFASFCRFGLSGVIGASDEPYRCESYENRKVYKRMSDGSDGRNQQRYWYGVESLDAAIRCQVTGWIDGVNKALESVDAIGDLPLPKSRRKRVVRGDTGKRLDVRDVYRGQPERAWRTKRRQLGLGPQHITLRVNVGSNCNVSSKDAFWRGACCIYTADKLASLGYDVEIIGVSKTVDMGPKVDSHSESIVIKPIGAPLDLSALACATALVGTYRTAGFGGHILMCDLLGLDIYNNLGRSSATKYDKHALTFGSDISTQPDARLAVEAAFNFISS